jgi:hypothetical protein
MVRLVANVFEDSAAKQSDKLASNDSIGPHSNRQKHRCQSQLNLNSRMFLGAVE